MSLAGAVAAGISAIGGLIGGARRKKAARAQAREQARQMRVSAQNLAGDSAIQLGDFEDAAESQLSRLTLAFAQAGQYEREKDTGDYETDVNLDIKGNSRVQDTLSRNYQQEIDDLEGKMEKEISELDSDASAFERTGIRRRYTNERAALEQSMEEQELLQKVQDASGEIDRPNEYLTGTVRQNFSRATDLIERDRRKLIADTQNQISEAYRAADFAQAQANKVGNSEMLSSITSIVGQLGSFGISQLTGPSKPKVKGLV